MFPTATKRSTLRARCRGRSRARSRSAGGPRGAADSSSRSRAASIRARSSPTPPPAADPARAAVAPPADGGRRSRACRPARNNAQLAVGSRHSRGLLGIDFRLHHAELAESLLETPEILRPRRRRDVDALVISSAPLMTRARPPITMNDTRWRSRTPRSARVEGRGPRAGLTSSRPSGAPGSAPAATAKLPP